MRILPTNPLHFAVLFLAACTAPIAPSQADSGTADAAPPDAGTPSSDAALDAEPDASGERERPCADCRAVEIAAGRAHTCARFDDGSVWCWGGNRWGELGDGRMRHESCTGSGDTEQTDCASWPVAVTIAGAAQLSARGGPSSCALRDDGTVSCWGLGLVVRPGMPLADVPRHDPEPLVAPSRVVDVSDGARHTCVVLADGRVTCRGMNGAGQLGTGTTSDETELVEVHGVRGAFDVEVSARGAFTCALTDTGVLCWGDASAGQLGDAPSAATCSDGLSRIPCALEPIAVAIDGDVVALSLGALHACALLSDGGVACWGENAAGQLGAPGVARSTLPIRVDGIGPSVSVSAGALFTCAVGEDGTVSCWGDDRYGAVGDGETLDARTCRVGSEVSSCVDTPRRVRGIEGAVSVTAGAAHACSLDRDGGVSCWGLNHQRQLGDGTRRERFEPVVALP